MTILDSPTSALLSTIKEHSKWTAHNICVAPGVYTMGKAPGVLDKKVLQVVQIVQDILPCPISSCSILDLACLEGMYGIEFALLGAKSVLAVEGRAHSIAKIACVKDLLHLSNLTILEEDIRNLTAKEHGVFQIVLFLGILYHLDAESILSVLQNVYEMCSFATIINTHTSVLGPTCAEIGGTKYKGEVFKEHRAGDSEETKAKRMWCSLDNVNSFWLTKDSLISILHRVGYSSIYECLCPLGSVPNKGRITLLAMKCPKIIQLATQPSTRTK